MSDLSALAERLRTELEDSRVIDDAAERATYDCDGLTLYTALPGLVVLAGSDSDVARTLRACRDTDTPFVARGSGTGLSGGALPRTDGVLLVLTRLDSILEVDAASMRARVEPGVINLDLTRATTPEGLYFAPDPSSQTVCSIGGNVAENSGGAHCLKYGFTTNHVTGLDLVTAEGEHTALGSDHGELPGYDLVGAVCGSEGTLGVVTEASVRLTGLPEKVVTLLAGFPSVGTAGEATGAIVATGIVPAALEMMDALAIEAAEAAVACAYPAGAGAVLVVELDGPAVSVDAEVAAVREVCERTGAFEIREAVDAEERGRIWKGRKSAFAAVGRISPDYLVQDGVVPRSKLGPVLREIGRLAEEAGLRVANVFHAGDGNLHPLVLFDAAVPGEAERAEAVSGAILELCVAEGGSITGEHGVGMDKAPYMESMFDAASLDTMQRLKCAFDPAYGANPGKVFPTPRLCGEPPRRHHAGDAHESALQRLGEVY